MSKKTGGPAFPTVDINYGGAEAVGANGMTLRDYFAAQAIHGLIAATIDDDYVVDISFSAYAHCAEVAYEMADAMLKARTT